MGAANRSPKIEAPPEPVLETDRLFTPASIPDAAVLYLTRSGSFDHVVQKNGPDFERERAIATEMIRDPKKFLRNPLSVICEKEELTSGRNFHHRGGADEKKGLALSRLEQYLNEASGTRRIFDTALLIADELYTNASKNSWKSGYLSKGPGENAGDIELFAHADTKRLVLGCRDSFGKLKVNGLLTRIDRCMTDGIADSIQRGAGGAGIGSILVFEAADSYYVGVSPDEVTVVCVTIRFASLRLTTEQRPKHIHLINPEDEGK